MRCEALVRERGNKFRACSNNALPLNKYCGGHLNAKKIYTHQDARRYIYKTPTPEVTTVMLSKSQKKLLDEAKQALLKNGLRPLKEKFPNLDFSEVMNFRNGQVIYIACKALLAEIEEKKKLTED